MTEIMTQQKAILEYLQKGYTMTPVEGWGVAKTMKLATRISELIKKGYPIIKEWYVAKSGKRCMSYRLAIDEDRTY